MARIRDAALVALVVFIACVLGTLTRPIGFLAAFWPANALLLGLLIRVPRLATPAGWIAAAAAYVAADLVLGGAPGLTYRLTTANMAMALSGFVLFQRLPDDDRRLARPQSVLFLFLICATAAFVAAAVGVGLAPLARGRSPLTELGLWFSTELVNSSIILPVILAAPRAWPAHPLRGLTLASSMPTLALLASVLVAVVVGGPGALAFPVPALLWCALNYSLFTTVLLTFAFCVWQIAAASLNILPLPIASDVVTSLVSMRLGIALLALGPLTVASVNAARNDVLYRLQRAATRDFLTDALSRSAFMSRAGAALAQPLPGGRLPAMLMLDIDHFKAVNDRYGHLAGDRVLVAFTGAVAGGLRDEDVFGRLGGEEFAVLLRGVSLTDALATAERLRLAVEQTRVQLKDGSVLAATVSIGLAYPSEHRVSLDSLLSAADQALYGAKLAGRNRVHSLEHQKSGVGLPPAGGLRPRGIAGAPER